MKRFLPLILILTIFAASCKKDDDTTPDDDNANTGNSDYYISFDFQGSTFKIEEGKDGFVVFEAQASTSIAHLEGTTYSKSDFSGRSAVIWFGKDFGSTPTQTEIDDLFKPGTYGVSNTTETTTTAQFNFVTDNETGYTLTTDVDQTNSAFVVSTREAITDPNYSYKVTGTFTCNVALDGSASPTPLAVTNGKFVAKMGSK